MCKKLLVRSIEFLLVDCSTVKFQCDNDLYENMSLGIITPSQQMLNYLIKGLTATMVVSYLILVQLHFAMLPYESQSSYEVYDWAKNRRGDYKRRQTNQKKANQRKKKNAYYGGRVQPQPDLKATERTKYQKQKAKILADTNSTYKSQAGVREAYTYSKDEIYEFCETKIPQWYEWLRIQCKVKTPDIPEDWDWKKMLWSFIEFAFAAVTTKLAKFVSEILTLLVALQFIEPVEITWRDRPVFKTGKTSEATLLSLVQKCNDAKNYLKECFRTWVKQPDATWSDILGNPSHDNIVDEYHELKNSYLAILLGRAEMDLQEYDHRVAKCVEAIKERRRDTTGIEKASWERMADSLSKIQHERVLTQKSTRRIIPFSILLYGGSGVGKSEMSVPLIRLLLEWNNFAHALENIVTINPKDKFQSEPESYHSGLNIEDLYNGLVDSTEDEGEIVVDVKNPTPVAILKAEAHLKGKVYWETKVMAATTNNKTFGSEKTVEPMSRVGRFNYTITVKVKKEWQTPEGKLDSDRVVATFGGMQFPPVHEFTVEYPSSVSETKIEQSPGRSSGRHRQTPKVEIFYKAAEHNGKKLIDVGIDEVLDFLKEKSQIYFVKERQMMAKHNESKTRKLSCEHCGMPEGVCFPCEQCKNQKCKCTCDTPAEHTCLKCKHKLSECNCTYESQAFEFLDSWKQWLLEMEEYIFSRIEQRFAATLLKKKGIAFLLWQCKDDVIQDTRSFSWRWLPMLMHVALIFAYLQHYSLGVLVVLILSVLAIVGIVVKCMYRQYKKWRRIPRISELYSTLPVNIQLKVWLALTGLISSWIVHKAYRMIMPAVIPSSQMMPGRMPTYKSKDKGPEKHHFWSDLHRNESYDYKVKGDQETKTTAYKDMLGIIKKRQWQVQMHTATGVMYSNCVPLHSGLLLIIGHFAPSKCCKATIIRPSANPINCSIGPLNCESVEGSDLSVVYLPEIGDQKNLIPYFVDQDWSKEKLGLTLVHNKHGEMSVSEKLLGTVKYIRATKAAFTGLEYSLPYDTFDGMCMATAIGSKNDTTFIAGFHAAGKGNSGVATIASKKAILDAVDRIQARPEVLVPNESQAFNPVVEGVNVGPLVPPSSQCATTKLSGDSQFELVGQHALPRGTPSTSVEDTLLAPKVAEIMGIERLHDKAYGLGAEEHRIRDLENRTHCAYNFNEESTKKAFDDFWRTIDEGTTVEECAKYIHKLPDIATVSGVDGVDGLNAMVLGTARGFPHKGIKRRNIIELDEEVEGITAPKIYSEEVLAKAAALEAELIAGRRSNVVFKASMKDEPCKITKTKRRVFAGCPETFTFTARKFLLTTVKFIQDRPDVFECSVGIDVHSPEWSVRMKKIAEYGEHRVIAGDYKSFDGRMSPRFMLMAFKIIMRLCEKSGNFDAEDLRCIRGIATEVCFPVVDYFGTLVKFQGSNPSGHPLTVVINSLVNSLYMRYAYYEIARKDRWRRTPLYCKVMKTYNYGDDNINGVKKGYSQINHTRISAELAEADIEYTMADKDAKSVPYISLSEAGFLKHKAIWDPELKLYRAQIEPDSIAKMLYCHVRSKVMTPEEHSAEAIHNVAAKYFDYGREVYTKRVEQLHKLAHECGLSGYVGTLPSYDVRLALYKDKFDL